MTAFDLKSLGEVVFEHRSTCAQADVVVVIPLYNYGMHIEDCLSSVVEQTLGCISIVIIDDRSTDAGPDLVEKFLHENATRFCSARLVRHRRNLGASMARNSGVAWTDEPLLFILDADNRIRPPALARLRSALEIDNADFAYSQLFIFGKEIDVGVADIWDIDRLRHGNAIDAMAMIRRSALLKAGGYAVLPDDKGWEDYDLWCRFFSLGMRGVFVPELLCEYRRHDQSRTEVEAVKNHETLLAQMVLRYPMIFNERPPIPERPMIAMEKIK
jgi:glycosyltransferase involved in cell wall biosynthesis